MGCVGFWRGSGFGYRTRENWELNEEPECMKIHVGWRKELVMG